jgi:fluoride exporter
MQVYLFVGIGGAIGSMLRYLVSIVTLEYFGTGFPYGTLIVNLVGSFALAWFTSRIIALNRIPEHLSAAIGTGLIGSFTTLSTLSVDVVTLAEKGHLSYVIIYLLVSILGGLVLAFTGLTLGEKRKMGNT